MGGGQPGPPRTNRSSRTSKIDTLAVRGGEPNRHAYDAVTVPIVCSATYAFAGTQEIRDHFDGVVEREEYGRYGNPTVRAAENKLAALEGAEDAVLFPTGMSAVTTLLLAMLKPGDHVVMTSDCYRRTRQFVATVLARFGVEHTLVEPGERSDDRPRACARSRCRVISGTTGKASNSGDPQAG